MFSILSMTVNAVASLFIHILKAVFSMLSWFVKAFVRALKLLFCLLPITAVLFALLFCANIFLLFSSGTAQPALKLPDAPDIRTPAFNVPAEEVIKGADKALENSSYVIVEMFTALKSWWLSSVYLYKGSVIYVFLLALTVVMFVPVITVLLSLFVFISFRNVLFVSVIADIILYLLRAFLGKNFIEQLMDRYYRLFPKAGKKHYERDYERWLRKHHREFTEDDDEDEEDEYYEEDDYEEDDYEDFYEDEDDIDDAEYEDEYAEDEYVEDEPAGSFDFFAGCSSRESLDRKYKSLVKLYHPDNMDGNTAALQEINIQYDRAKKRFK